MVGGGLGGFGGSDEKTDSASGHFFCELSPNLTKKNKKKFWWRLPFFLDPPKKCNGEAKYRNN